MAIYIYPGRQNGSPILSASRIPLSLRILPHDLLQPGSSEQIVRPFFPRLLRFALSYLLNVTVLWQPGGKYGIRP